MFNAIEKVAIATVGTTAAFIAANKLQALPGYFMAPPTPGVSGDANAMRIAQEDNRQQRVNSFAAGIIAGGVATGIVLAIWRK
jgi:hypothetical protein